MDVEVTTNQEKAEFEVAATGNHLDYQWYFKDQVLEAGKDDGRKKYVGVNEPKLTVISPQASDWGFYHCEIDSVDANGMPHRTATRWAALGYAGERSLLLSINPPAQPLPPPGSPAKSACGGNYCSWVSFRNGGAGYHVAQGNNCIAVAANGSPLATSAYFVVVYDTSSPATPICVTNVNGQMCFTGSSADTYLFTVCFKCSTCPAKSPLISMTITP